MAILSAFVIMIVISDIRTFAERERERIALKTFIDNGGLDQLSGGPWTKYKNYQSTREEMIQDIKRNACFREIAQSGGHPDNCGPSPELFFKIFKAGGWSYRVGGTIEDFTASQQTIPIWVFFFAARYWLRWLRTGKVSIRKETNPY
jgi:hypothetical protein